MSEADDIKTIRDMYAGWRVAVETGNIPGYLACLDEDVRMIPPGGPDVVSREAYGAFLQPVFDGIRYAIEPKSDIEIEFHGNIALARYRYVVTLTFEKDTGVKAADGALTDTVNDSKYFDVLRRQPDGTWKTYIHTWNASPPEE